LFIPFGFGNGEFFADFDLGVVDGEADDVYLEPFGGEFEAFCFGFLALASIPSDIIPSPQTSKNQPTLFIQQRRRRRRLDQ